MNLKEIRTEFVKKSGRFDLVEDTTNYTDDGADFFIQAGQRFLDQQLDSPKSKAVHPVSLIAGDTEIKADRCRSVNQIWLVREGKKLFLDRIPFVDFQEYYGDFTNVEDGVPTFYTIQDLRDTTNPVLEDLSNVGILIGPKSDAVYNGFVRGKFYSYSLDEDTDFNFWSVEYPQTLIQGALYTLERFYRNTQGMNDHLLAIQRDLQGIDFDVVEMNAQQQTAMSDSFNERRHRPRRNSQINF